MAKNTEIEKEIEKTEVEEILFTKEQIISSKKYANRRDVLGAILSSDKTYTSEQVESLLDKFMKGKVN